MCSCAWMQEALLSDSYQNNKSRFGVFYICVFHNIPSVVSPPGGFKLRYDQSNSLLNSNKQGLAYYSFNPPASVNTFINEITQSWMTADSTFLCFGHVCYLKVLFFFFFKLTVAGHWHLAYYLNYVKTGSECLS